MLRVFNQILTSKFDNFSNSFNNVFSVSCMCLFASFVQKQNLCHGCLFAKQKKTVFVIHFSISVYLSWSDQILFGKQFISMCCICFSETILLLPGS